MAPGDPETAAVSDGAVSDGAVSNSAVSDAETPVTVAPEPAAAPSAHPDQPARAALPAHTANGSGAPAAPLVESGQIRRAIALAQKRTDLNWSVFIGTLGSEPRKQAEARHAELGPAADKSVLIAVDPAAHHLEIVTGVHARRHLDDRSCALAAAAMTASFAVRDLDGGIAYGILAMVEHVRSVR